MDGLVATARIKAQFPQARILMVTQCDSDGLRQAAQQAGACAYVLKEDLPDVPKLDCRPPRPRIEPDVLSGTGVTK